MTLSPPSYITKAETKKIPFVGKIAMALGTMLVVRGSKGARNSLLAQINEKEK